MWRLFDVHTDGSDGETAQCGVEAVPIRLVFEDVEQRRRDVVHRRERTGEFARVQSTLLIAEFDLSFLFEIRDGDDGADDALEELERVVGAVVGVGPLRRVGVVDLRRIVA